MQRNHFVILFFILFCSCSTTPVKKQNVVLSKDYKGYVKLKEEPEHRTVPQKIADVFTLRTHDGKHYHMLAKTYHKLARPHSALATGWRGKSSEVPQNVFIDNATEDLRNLINEVVHDFGTLEEFF